MMERGIARDDYRVLDDCRNGNRLRHQRFACAVPEEKYCPGLCATEFGGWARN